MVQRLVWKIGYSCNGKKRRLLFDCHVGPSNIILIYFIHLKHTWKLCKTHISYYVYIYIYMCILIIVYIWYYYCYYYTLLYNIYIHTYIRRMYLDLWSDHVSCTRLCEPDWTTFDDVHHWQGWAWRILEVASDLSHEHNMHVLIGDYREF